MTREVGDEPDELNALHAAVDEAVEPGGQLEWDRVLRAVCSAPTTTLILQLQLI